MFTFTITPHVSQYDSAEHKAANAPRTMTFTTRAELDAELDAYGIPRNVQRQKNACQFGGERYEWTEVAEIITITEQVAVAAIIASVNAHGANAVRTADAVAVATLISEINDPAVASLDIPAAVRDYIEAEWRGAALVMADRRDVILAHLLATDPKLGLTAATFRFHKLVAEMRDNDSIEPAPLAELAAAAVAANDGLPLNVLPAAQGLAALEAIAAEPQHVTISQRRRFGQVQHLVNADNDPVTAGEHITDTGLRFVITDEPDASCDRETGEPVRIAVTYCGSGQLSWIKAEMLVTGWHWQAERV